MKKTLISRRINEITDAIVYLRAASASADNNNHALLHQEENCRAWAKEQGFKVRAVFSDSGISGLEAQRPGIRSVLDYLRAQPEGQQTLVIIHDVLRLARSPETHASLRAAISDAGGVLVMPGMESYEAPEHELMVNTLTALAQYEDEKGGAHGD